LYQYYDGFLFTLCQSYDTAVVVNSGTLSIDTGDPVIDGAKALISMIPFCGSGISEGIGIVKDFVKTAKVTKAAANVTEFATESSEFKEIAQDAVVALIVARQDIIKKLEKEQSNRLTTWKAKFQKVWESVKDGVSKVEEFLYGARMKTDLQKLGQQTARDVVAEYIANRKIWGEGGNAFDYIPEEKTKLLIEVSLTIVDHDINASKLVTKENGNAHPETAGKKTEGKKNPAGESPKIEKEENIPSPAGKNTKNKKNQEKQKTARCQIF